MGDKDSNLVDKGLSDLFGKIGVVSKEFFTEQGKLHIYLAFNKPYVTLDNLIELQKTLGSEEIRIYTQAYSKFESIKHTGVIFCINNLKAS
jgi:hypothetical protein